MSGLLFRGDDASYFFGKKRQLLISDIDKIDAARVLGSTLTDLAKECAMARSIGLPTLREDKICWDREDVIQSSGRHGSMPAIKITFIIPFEGNMELFGLQSPELSQERILGEADSHFKEGSFLRLVYGSTDADPSYFREKFKQDLGRIRRNLEILVRMVKEFNESLYPVSLERFQARANLLKERDWETELGYPRRKADL